jgi:predicted Holliday junction resolvase-like endonuclease
MLLLDIVLPNWVVGLTLVALVILGINIASQISNIRKENTAHQVKLVTLEGVIREKDLAISIIKTEINGQAQELATIHFDTWKEKELDAHRKIIFDAASERAKGLLREWILDEEKGLRKDAIVRSMGVNLGKITEHLVPFSDYLKNFNPRDMRFIGSPVDLIIFDGLTTGNEIVNIHLVEIKTGSGKLSKKQKIIRNAVEFNRVHWLPVIVPDFKWDTSDDDE